VVDQKNKKKALHAQRLLTPDLELSTKILTLIFKLSPGTYKVPFQNLGSAHFFYSFFRHGCIKNQSIGRLQIFEKCQIYILVDHYALLLPE